MHRLSGILGLKMRNKGTLEKEANQISLTMKTTLLVCNRGSVEYCTWPPCCVNERKSSVSS